ncbi:Cytochrome P450 [Penicillium expansum]|nr:Cytochrome P450 [Penicillium expansum]
MMHSYTIVGNSPSTLLALAGFSGLTAHVLLYRRGEWDLKAPRLVISYIFLFISATFLERYKQNDLPPAGPSHLAAKLIGCHILGIYTSMLFYRAFLHRLSRFPGPFLAKLSNFYVTALSARKLHLYEETEKLHELYGDYVRLGPTELSITDPRAVKAIYSSSAKVSKGPWYTVLEPRVSLQMVRNRQEHARRKKVWDQGFSSRALRDYEPRVSHYTEQLINVIEREVGNQINISQWFNYYSFDVMGDLAFGKSFNMLIDGKDAYILKQLHADMKGIGLFSHLTWLFPFFKKIPVINAEYLKFWKWVDGRVYERIQNTPDRPDVFSWILKAYEQGPKTRQDSLDLHGDAYLIIVAGSDTTAATLTNIFFHLASDRTLYKALQTKLDALSSLSHDKLTGVKLLDAIINETLRLHPAVPSGTQRLTPPEGITIGNTYIPGNVMVCIPQHTLFRDERIFVRPRQFLPERWNTQPELVKDPTAFIPFNTGPYSCVGKQLGLMELRSVTAEILTRYDVSFAPDQTAAAFLDGKQDTFTLATAPLKLVFQKRENKRN